MGHADLLIAVVLVLQAFVGLGWTSFAWFLRLAPAAAAQWALASVLIACALTLFLLRGRVPDLLGHALGNSLSLAALIVIRRGLQAFLNQPRRDLEQGLLLAGCLLFNIALARPGSGAASVAAVVGTSSCVAWTLWRITFEVGRPLRQEFGRRVAWLASTPYAIGATLFTLRATLGLWLPAQVARPIHVDTVFNMGVVFVVLVLNLAINASQGTMMLMRLVRRLERLSRHDSLTGLFNRRALMEALDVEAARLRRGGSGSALIMIDADHFKSVNDRFGHTIGDQALRVIGDVMLGSVRDSDVAARMGGEEFCLLLPMTDADGARQTGERIRQALSQQVRERLPELPALTLSMGIVVLPAGCTQPAPEWIQAADRALYRAKDLGRDRIEMAVPMTG